MRKVIVFLYFVFLFKLAFANSLPNINVFGDKDLANIEPASGVQLAQAQVPPLPAAVNEQNSPLPADFDLPTLDGAPAENNQQANNNSEEKTEEFESAPLPPTVGTGAVPPANTTEVSEIPTIPQEAVNNAQQVGPAIAEKNNENLPNKVNNEGDLDIDQIISESSVRDQFPETPDLKGSGAKKRQEKNDNVIPISKEQRDEEVDSLLNEVFDKGKTEEELAKEQEESEKEQKLVDEVKDKKQLDIPMMEDVVSVDDMPIESIDSLAEGEEDLLPLDALPGSMRPNYESKIADNGRAVSTSSTYSERQLSEFLVTSSMRGDRKAVIDLINSGRSPNSQNQFGETALMGAVYSGNNEIVEILISEGADPNIPDNKGNTSLIVASARNNIQAVQQLVKAGADIDLANNSSDTPLLVASLNNNNQVIDTLVRQGGDINKPNAEGLTALHIAAYNDNAVLARYLLNLGANPNLIARGGFKPYDLIRNKNGQTAQLLYTYITDMQRQEQAARMAQEIKARNTAPVANPIVASADPYSIFPKAYAQNETAAQQQPVTTPKSDWWAAKNEPQLVKANYAQPVIEQAPQQPVQQFADISELANQSEQASAPASLAFKNYTESKKPANNLATQSASISQNNQQYQATQISNATPPITNKMQKSVPVDSVEVQTLNVQTQTSAPKIVEQPKQWRKLTVDQNALKKEQEAKIIQQNQALQAFPQNTQPQQLVRAVYDNNGNIISQNSAPQVAVTTATAQISAPVSQPASFAASNLNKPLQAIPVANNRQMQIQTMPQAQPAPISQNGYNQLDTSKQQAWDLRLQQWVKDGYFFGSFNDIQKATWLGQQKVFESVYQDQFNFKVESIKKQLTGGAPNNAPQSGVNNYYGQQSLSQQGAFVTSYAAGNAPLSQTF